MVEMSVWWDSVYAYIEPYWNIIRLVLIIIIAFIVLNLILRVIKRNLLKLTKNKKQAASVTIFIDMLKYLFSLIFIIIVVFSYYNSWGELGFIAGLMTVAIGWALQKPISGVVAWLIIIARRPFNVGDRINFPAIPITSDYLSLRRSRWIQVAEKKKLEKAYDFLRVYPKDAPAVCIIPYWNKMNGLKLRNEELDNMLHDIKGLNVDGRIKITGLDRGRAEVILAGFLSTSRIMKFFDARDLTVSMSDILEGLLIDELEGDKKND